MAIYWWVPAFTNWAINSVTEGLPADNERPVEILTSSVTTEGNMAYYGRAADGDVLRLSWETTDGSIWTHENVTDLAVRG